MQRGKKALPAGEKGGFTPTPDFQQNQVWGFTLIESIVVVVIITIVTYLVMAALPAARTNQALENDLQTIRSSLNRAQQEAVNEVRSEECVQSVGDPNEARRCSDIGVSLTAHELQLFSDLDGNQHYSAADFTIARSELAANSVTNTSVVFEADPPTVVTYINGQVIGGEQVVTVILELNDTQRIVTIGPYGVVEYAQ